MKNLFALLILSIFIAACGSEDRVNWPSHPKPEPELPKTKFAEDRFHHSLWTINLGGPPILMESYGQCLYSLGYYECETTEWVRVSQGGFVSYLKIHHQPDSLPTSMRFNKSEGEAGFREFAHSISERIPKSPLTYTDDVDLKQYLQEMGLVATYEARFCRSSRMWQEVFSSCPVTRGNVVIANQSMSLFTRQQSKQLVVIEVSVTNGMVLGIDLWFTNLPTRPLATKETTRSLQLQRRPETQKTTLENPETWVPSWRFTHYCRSAYTHKTGSVQLDPYLDPSRPFNDIVDRAASKTLDSQETYNYAPSEELSDRVGYLFKSNRIARIPWRMQEFLSQKLYSGGPCENLYP